MDAMIWLAAGLIFLALWLWARGRRDMLGFGLQGEGLQGMRPVYWDLDDGRPLESALVSHRLKLAGRPDLIVEHRVGGGEIHRIPVELKPMRKADRPYRGDLMQLASYCMLIEDLDGRPPPFGILAYADRHWQVDFDDELRRAWWALNEAMDEDLRAGDAPRDHDNPGRCAACGMRTHCEQALV